MSPHIHQTEVKSSGAADNGAWKRWICGRRGSGVKTISWWINFAMPANGGARIRFGCGNMELRQIGECDDVIVFGAKQQEQTIFEPVCYDIAETPARDVCDGE